MILQQSRSVMQQSCISEDVIKTYRVRVSDCRRKITVTGNFSSLQKFTSGVMYLASTKPLTMELMLLKKASCVELIHDVHEL